MINKAELLRWLNTLNDDSSIGIDEDGICLVEVLAINSKSSAYLEVGGVPLDVE